MTDLGPELAHQLQSSLLSSRGIAQDRWVLPALLPLLAQGQPVTVADLARASGRAEQDVQQACPARATWRPMSRGGSSAMG